MHGITLISGTTDTTVNAKASNYPGMIENTSHPDRIASGIILGDGSLILKLYYYYNTYKVEHYKLSDSGTWYYKTQTENLTGTPNTTANAIAKDYPGFSENTSFSQRIPSGIITENGSLILKLY